MAVNLLPSGICRPLFPALRWKCKSGIRFKMNFGPTFYVTKWIDRSRDPLQLLFILNIVMMTCLTCMYSNQTCKNIPWPKTASELYRPSDRRLSENLVPTFADRGCRVVNVTDFNGSILGSLHRNRYFFFQVAPQLHSWDWVDPVPDALLFRKSGSAGNRTLDLWPGTLSTRPQRRSTILVSVM
jgi:hypothetical protein